MIIVTFITYLITRYCQDQETDKRGGGVGLYVTDKTSFKVRDDLVMNTVTCQYESLFIETVMHDLYNRRLLPLWADLVCQPVQRLLYLYTYLYNSNCNMFATYLISLLAHAIYPTYLIKLYVFSNVCILDFTQSPIVQVLTEPSHMLLGVVSVYCGIDNNNNNGRNGSFLTWLATS